MTRDITTCALVLLFGGLLVGAVALATRGTPMFFGRNRKRTDNATTPTATSDSAEFATLRQRHTEVLRELDNAKRRHQKEIDAAVHEATQELLASIFPVGDNLDRALTIAPRHASPQLVEGLRMVRDIFLAALAKHGIVPIATVGEPFDPRVHEALHQVDSPEHPPGVVVLEHERGYRRGARLLRAARVIVAGPGLRGAASR